MSPRDVRRFAPLAGMLAVVVSLSAQQSPSGQDSEFAALLSTAQQSYTDHQWDAATAQYQSIVNAARGKRSELWEGRGLLGLAKVANEKTQYADARERAREALAIFERLNATNDIGDANRTLGISAYSMNQDAVAQSHYERAIAAYSATGNARSEADARFRLVRMHMDNEADSLEYAKLQAAAQGFGDKVFEGQILHSWGDALFTQSQYEQAIEKLDQAAACYEQTKSLSELGTVYNSLGRLYRAHGQPVSALQFQLKALETHQSGTVPRLYIQSLNAVAVTYGALGDYDRARTYYERALAVAEAAGATGIPNILKANLGVFLAQAGELERGRQLLEEAMAAGGGFTSVRYTQLSIINWKLGRYSDALAAAQKAFDTCRSPEECRDARNQRGYAHLALGDEAAALDDQRAVLASVEATHAKLVRSDRLKQAFHHLWEPAYSLAIELYFRRGQYREALEAAELARARAFLDLLASRDLKRAAAPGVVAALPDRASPLPVESLGSEASAPPPTLGDLTAIASRLDSTLLAYWVGENKVYAWVLSPDGRLRGTSVNVSRTKLDELIRSSTAFAPTAATPGSAQQAIAARGATQIALSVRNQRTWRALYDLLIAPLEHELPQTAGARLTIVPYGPLLDVPFAALRDARGRYLIERYTIHSVPAGAVLQFTAAKVRSDARGGDVLLVGDPARLPKVPGEPPLPRLAGASDEVRAIARLLPASRTTVLAGAAATEPRVRSTLPGKAVIHFATHGIVRDGNPLASFLALGTVGDGPADGRLTADKIYGLDLEANLIVLSACRSGGGVITGDGIAGLARAFFYAGTPSVIVSVWDVADQPTNQLLPAFYRAWLNGADKASALRTAQLALIRRLRAGQVKVTLPAGTFVLPEDPAFWAAFVLLGEPD